jgi:triacylglycerol lipase
MPQHSSLARLLQLSCFAQLAAAAAWVAWRWPASHWQAAVGAALILFSASLVLAGELLIVSWVARSDPAVPRPTAPQLLRAWLSETRHFYRTFSWRQPFRWRAVDDHLPPHGAGRCGVVLVHGFMCNRGFWTPWLRALRDSGHPCLAVNLEPVHGSIEEYVEIVDHAVRRVADATGRPPLLVAHSMGGLAARAWWRASRGRQPLAHLVTIASPHHGTWLARFARKPNTRQMQLESEWLRALAQHEREHPLPPTTCWYSNCDNVVFPPSTATLAGAQNRFVPGVPHVALAFAPQVLAGCLQLLAGLRAGGQGQSVTETAPAMANRPAG